MARTLHGAGAPGGDPPCWAHLGDAWLYAAVRDSVITKTPIDDRERRSIDEFLEHYDRLVAPFDEDASPVHVTGSCVIVGERGVVLHRHRRLGTVLQPGGHIDAGETPWEAALREGREETGLVLQPAGPAGPAAPHLLHVDVHPGPRGHTHLDLRYLMDGGDADPAPGAGESPDVHWFDWPEAIDIADEGLGGLLRAMRGGDVAAGQ